MLSVGFWNVKDGLAGYGPIAHFAREMAVDAVLSGAGGETLLCIAEPGGLTPAGLLAELQAVDPGHNWWTQSSTSGRFLLAGTIDPGSLQFRPESGGGWPCLLTRPGGGSPLTALLWFVHLASPMGVSNPDAHMMRIGSAISNAVKATEIAESNARSILVGDFNMRPYDVGMLAPSALNAAACRHAARRPRKVDGVLYEYFYNPCWELLGNWELGTRQPGTFYNLDATDSVRWWLIDQVLIRPNIADWLVGRTPRIVTRVGPHDLVTPRGVIAKAVSDHLPVVASLSI